MSNLVRDAFRQMRKEADRPVLNPYATAHAAEVLAAEGKHSDAAAVRAEIDPTNDLMSGDPLDFWLAVEDLESSAAD